jgi:hypothetical protein
MLEEAEKYPPEYDEDSPKLTLEQLAQFKPVHFASMEDRTRHMKSLGMIESEEVLITTTATSRT